MPQSNSSVLMKDPYRYMDNLYNILNEKIDNLELEVEELEEEQESHVTFMLNGKEITVNNVDPEVTLNTYLRNELNYFDTKLNCGIGFCGVCTVTIAKKSDIDDSITEQSFNSCLLKLFKCNGCAITTLDGIRDNIEINNGALNEIQNVFMRLNSLQCGYCTPGFIMKIYSSVINLDSLPTFDTINKTLTGNNCRCTGYRPIVEAFKVILILISKGTSGISKEDVIKSSDSDRETTYSSEYDTLVEKWNLDSSPDFSVIDINSSFPNSVYNNNYISHFVSNFSYTKKLFASDVYGYKCYVPTTLDEFKNVLEKEGKVEYYIQNGFTAQAITPIRDQILDNFNSNHVLINISLVKELNGYSNLGTSVEFNANLTQSDVKSILESSSDTKLSNLANYIELIAGDTVRNLATPLASVILTIKNNFRGDWATCLTGAKTTYNYSIYTITNEDSKNTVTFSSNSGNYNTLSNAYSSLNTNQLLLITSFSIPKEKTNEHYNCYRTATRDSNAQAYANISVSSIKNGSSYSNMTVVVGAINSNIQQFTVSGAVNLENVVAKLNDLTYTNEVTYVNRKDNIDPSKYLVVGLFKKYLMDDASIVFTKKSTFGEQYYLASDPTDETNDYRIQEDSQILYNRGGVIQQNGKTTSDVALTSTRDRLADFVPYGEDLTNLKSTKPLYRRTYWRVLGKEQYGFETKVSNPLYLQLIISNIDNGYINFNSSYNSNLLNKYRSEYNCNIIANDNETMNTLFENPNDEETKNNLQKYYWNFGRFVDPTLSLTVQAFNTPMPGFNSWTHQTYSSGPNNRDMGSVFDTTITSYGQIIGYIAHENLDICIKIASELSNQLENTPSESATTYKNLYNSDKLLRPSVLNDKNLSSKDNCTAFTSSFARLCGSTTNVKTRNPNWENMIISPEDEPVADDSNAFKHKIGNNQYYTLPYHEQEKNSAFFVNCETGPDGSIYKDTIGNGLYQAVGLGNTQSDWMENHQDWYNSINPDENHKTFKGKISSTEQAWCPMEGLSFTVEYTSNVITVTGGFQDPIILGQVTYLLSLMRNNFIFKLFDSNGNFVKTYDTNKRIKFNSISAGGGFGYKYGWASVKLEGAILLAILTRLPIKYQDNFLLNDYQYMGRYTFGGDFAITINNSRNLVGIASDTIVGVNNGDIVDSSNVSGIFTATVTETMALYNQFPNYASRASLVKLNTGFTGPVRGFGQTEGMANLYYILARASALTKTPVWKLHLEALPTVDNNTRTTTEPYVPIPPGSVPPPDNLKYPRDNVGLPVTSELNEYVFNNLLLNILKNLSKNNYPNTTTKSYTTGLTIDSSIAEIRNKMEDYYNDVVMKFNDANTFKKRGMGITCYGYKVLTGYNNSMKLNLQVNLNNGNIHYECGVVDHGTGSAVKPIRVLADMLRLDPDLFVVSSGGLVQQQAGLMHAGSNTALNLTRAAFDAGLRFQKAILERYPINVVYNLLRSAFGKSYPTRNYTIILAPAETIILDVWTHGASLAWSIVPTKFSNNDTVDLSTLSGADIFRLYEAAFPQLALRGATLANGQTNRTSLQSPDKAPDLLREMIVRTLEFEYSINKIPVFLGAPEPVPAQGHYAFDELVEDGYYLNLVDKTRATYIPEIKQTDMMNRWLMITQHIGISILDTDKGSPTWNITTPTSTINSQSTLNVNFGGVGGQYFGLPLGGLKQNPLKPNDNSGNPIGNNPLNNISSTFLSVVGDINVTGSQMNNPNWTIDTTSILAGFELTISYSAILTVSEMDCLTGEHKIIRIEAAGNTDRTLDGVSDLGQLEGGAVYGLGNQLLEDVGAAKENGERSIGFWHNKIPLAGNGAELFNVSLLNVENAYAAGQIFTKGVAEICTATGTAAISSSVRDCIINFRHFVNNKLGVNSPFKSDDDINDPDSCNYTDDLFNCNPINCKRAMLLTYNDMVDLENA